jgi:hypothetical protein
MPPKKAKVQDNGIIIMPSSSKQNIWRPCIWHQHPFVLPQRPQLHQVSCVCPPSWWTTLLLASADWKWGDASLALELAHIKFPAKKVCS